MYLRWRRLLPRSVRLVPVELPGRGVRMGEPFEEDLGRLAARLCDEQAEAMRDADRFMFFGHSMGALLAHGMARRLRDIGAPLPQALLVSGCAAPSRRDPGRFEGLDDDASLEADLRRQGGTPQEVFASAELLRITLDVLAADYRLCRSFEPASMAGAPLPVPVHAFAGRHDDIEAAAVEAWSAETSDAFTLDWFDGGHFFIRQHEADFVGALIRRLGRNAEGVARAIPAFA